VKEEQCRLTVQSLFEGFQRAMIAVVPIAEGIGISWREPDNYDEWDAISSGLFDGFVLTGIRSSEEWLTGFFPLISYDVRKNDLADLSYFSTIWADSKYLFICLETNKVPFDTCLLANLRNGVEVLSLVRAPFVECRFELVACDGTTHRVINAIHW